MIIKSIVDGFLDVMNRGMRRDRQVFLTPGLPGIFQHWAEAHRQWGIEV